jgi:class 3 adenylate cyclase/tetratricopeptide (TPR) repeat protein
VPACPVCGLDNPEGFRFCGSCGAQIEAPQSPFEERRVVTVLFADLVGFTSTVDQRDPEDVRRMLAPYYRRLRRELVKVGGTVEKFIGDAVMAIFGAPVAHEDDAERAVRAALAIRDAIAELGEEGNNPGLSVRIGINTGEAIFALDVAHYEGERIIADFVNVASRLQEAAPVDAILVGETTFRTTERKIEYEPFGAVHAKGKAEPVPAYRALASRARVGVDPYERGQIPLVGRLHEVQLLCDAFARVRREHSAQLVTIVGVPGIGKSRLVFELQSVVEDDPELVTWRRGACLPYGDGLTFWPLAEMVKAQAGILETDAAELVVEKLREAVRDVIADDEDSAWVETCLRPLVGLAGEEDAERRQREEDFAGWRHFFEALARHNPTVLIFEDLHWADEGLLDFIDHLVDWASAVPLLVVCTARTELLARRPNWGGGKTNAVTISVGPLSDDETARLLAELLEQAVMPAALQSQLLARAGGNPLYAEEFVRMLADRERSQSGDDLPLPDSVQGILAARLDALPLEQRAILQNAAVIGRRFWVGALEWIGDAARPVLEQHLRSLERAEFVRRQPRSAVAGETEYAFRHLLLGDVAYGRIPRARRAERHRVAAEWLESLVRLEDQAEMVAYHYGRALELARASGETGSALEERARVAFREAGDRAAALKSWTAASRFYSSALELTAREDEDWPVLRFRYGRALFFAEEEGDEALSEARDALIAAGDRGTAAEAESILGQLAFRLGERDRSFDHYEQALGLLEGEPPSASKAAVLATLSRSLVVAARSEEALQVGREALAMAEELGLVEFQAKALVSIGDARVELGDLGGMQDFSRGVELALSVNSSEAASALINLADTVMDLGDIARARELRVQAQDAAERSGDAKCIRWLRAEYSGESFWLGDWDGALELADQVISESETGRRHYQESYCRVIRGRIRLTRGDLRKAMDDAEQAVEFARVVQDPQALYPTLAFWARTLLAAGRVDDAAAPVDELLGLIREKPKAPVSYLWLLDMAVALADLGRGHELVEATAPLPKATPWLAAARAVAAGRPDEAAAIYARIGARPDEALAHMRMAAKLMAAGRGVEADTELALAISFYKEVGAAATIEAGERLHAT